MITKELGTVTSNFQGNFETNKFSIAVNGKAFKTLLDTLYTNKIRAVIRELWTNAYDSHIEAGIPDTPFDCHLPTMLTPTFSVRDYGVSLTHEMVMELYTTLFKSTKDLTDELVGMLGLGSKSPFAYTDQFTVTTWLDGVKRVYVASIGQDGIPTISHLTTEFSDEPTGLEVSFPVQSKDYTEFQNAANLVALGFDVIPNVTGNPITKREPVLTGPGWKIYKGIDDSVRQGCVIYPISSHQVSYKKCTNYNHGIVVDVAIGTVDIAANREALSFDDKTKANVQELFKATYEGVYNFCHDELAKSGSFIEASRLAFTYGVSLNFSNKWTYKGEKINGYVSIKADKDKAFVPVYDKKNDRVFTFSVQDLKNAVVVVDRGQKVLRKKLRIKKYLNNWSTHAAYYVENPTNTQMKMMMRKLGLRPDQFVSVVTLPDVPKGVSMTGIDKSGIYSVNMSMYPQKSDPPAEGEEYIWVSLDKGVPSGYIALPQLWQGGQFQSHYNYILVLRSLLGISQIPFGLTKNARKRLDVQPENELSTIFKDKLDKILPDLLKVMEVMVVADSSGSLNYNYRDVIMDAMFTPEEVETYRNNLKLYQHVYVRTYLSKYHSDKNEDNGKILEEYKKNYPLIFDPNHATIVQYINERKALAKP